MIQKLTGFALILVCAIAAFPNWARASDAGTADSATASASSTPGSSSSTTAPTRLAAAGPAADPGAQLQTVVVTARRRTESAQSTPVALTTFTPQQLQAKSVTNFESLSEATPALDYSASPYGAFQEEIGIRGQQATDIVLAQSPAVGIYVDDVYDMTGETLDLLNYDDVSDLEVLKGPQGTLYGRNTTGGAIKVTTALPDYDGVHGSGKVTFGNYGDKVVSTTINLPVVDQHLAVELAGRFENRGGFGSVEGTGRQVNSLQSESFRAAVRLDVTDKLQFIARGWYGHGTSGGQPADLTYVAPGATAANLAVATEIGALTPTDFGILAGAITPTPAQLAAFGADVNKGYQALSSYIRGPYYQGGFAVPQALLNAFGVGNIGLVPYQSEADVSGGSLTGSYQLTPNVYLKSITADSVTRRSAQQNTGGSPFLLIYGYTLDQEPRQFSEEFQVGGTALEDALHWVAGYYYYDMNGFDDSNPVVQVAPLGPTPSRETAQVSDISKSGYTQATYSITHDVHFTGGLRYTAERSGNVSATTVNVGAGTPPLYSSSAAGVYCQSVSATTPYPLVSPPTPNFVSSPLCRYPTSTTFDNWSYTAGPDWQITPDTMVYAKTSRAFRAGGTGIRPPFAPFKPEESTDYEAGVKSEWFEHHFRLNFDIYQTNYDNIQRTVLTDIPGTSQVDTAILNAASGRIRGAELELLGRPLDWLTLDLNGAFTDAGYISYINPGTGADDSDHVFENVPRWKGDMSATYQNPDPLGELTGTVDFEWKSWVDFQPDNHVTIAPGVLSDGSTIQGGYGMFNARLTQNIRALDDLKVSIWGRNLANKQYVAYGTDITGQLGFVEVQPGEPRTFGVDISKQF